LRFAYSCAKTDMLLGAMPQVVPLRDEDDKAGLRWSLDRMRQEMTTPRPGGPLIVEHLAHLLLVQALRLYLYSCTGRTVGWLFALSDPKIAARSAR